MTIEFAAKIAKIHYDTATGEVAKFQASLAKDPFYALSWGESGVRAIVDQSCWEAIIGILAGPEPEAELTKLRKQWTKRVLGGEWLSHSSSDFSNATNRVRHDVIAHFIQDADNDQLAFIQSLAAKSE